MDKYSVTDSIRYVGVKDFDLDLFESQYPVPDGVTYNSYVILDDKVAVMDTVDKRGGDQWFANVREALGGRSVDYLVVSHMEPDGGGHPGSGPAHPSVFHGSHGPLAGGDDEL